MRLAWPGFRGRLLIGAVLPAFLMVALLEVVFLSRYQADLERSFQQRGQAIARQLGAAAEYALFSGSRETLGMLAEGIRHGDPAIMSIEVLDRGGTPLARSGTLTQRPLPLKPTLQIATDDGITVIQAPIEQVVLPIGEAEGLLDGAARQPTTAVTGFIVVELSRAELEARKREMLEVTFVIMLAGLLLASGLSLRIAAGVLRSLDVANAELQQQKEMAEALARTDALTGLANRRAFEEAAHQALQRARRYRTPLALIITDIDHFKMINDTYGHHFGDVVLRDFAATLSASVRNVDLVGRWGGEEFVVLAPDTHHEEALQAAERMRLAIAGTPTRLAGHACGYTASFGVASLQMGAPTLEALLANADKALYRAKHNGRNRVESA